MVARSQKLETGFSLLELLVVAAIIGLVAAVLLPAFSTAKNRARKLACLNNLKQLQLAWGLYAEDSADALVFNTFAPGLMTRPWDATNTAKLERGPLYPYCKSTAVYKCPADVAPNPQSQVVTVRSFSMNSFLNGYDTAAVYASVSDVYTVQTKLSLINSPPSAGRMVFVDESQNTLDDCNFAVIPSLAGTSYPTVDHWNNYPSARHGNSAALSFADGHVVVHQWAGGVLSQLETSSSTGNYTEELTGPDLADLRAIQDLLALPPGQN